jgi:hypothetical protein
VVRDPVMIALPTVLNEPVIVVLPLTFKVAPVNLKTYNLVIIG